MQPAHGRGYNPRSHGVQQLHPNHPGNHPWNRRRYRACAPDSARGRRSGWRRTRPGLLRRPGQRLATYPRPAVQAHPRPSRLPWTGGWTPHALAAFTGANTTGVHRPYAVLAARLSPGELPTPPVRSARPPWCGQCDQTTRMLDFHGDAPRPCPRCEPAAYAPQDRPVQTALTASIALRRRRPAWGPARPRGATPSQSAGKDSQAPPSAGPSPHSPIMMIMDGERIPRHPPCRSRAYGDHLRGSWRDAPIASSAGSGAAGKALLPVSRACIRSNGRS